MAQPFKEHVNRASVERLADALAGVRGFDRRTLRAAAGGLEPLELKARIAHVARGLAEALPGFGAAGAVAGAVADSDLSIWEAWPAQTWVEQHGLGDPRAALDAMAVMTARASAEFAVRPYLHAHPELAWAAVRDWAAADDEHRRRLASEGTRPRLPWGRAVPSLIADPAPGLAVIDGLRDDPSAYVRRSVANHLNDVARDNPQAALALAGTWSDAQALARGLRWLVKRGDPRALALLGVDADTPLEVDGPDVLTAQVALGSHLRFAVEVRAPRGGRVALDYLLGPRDGALKVFKGAVRDLAAGEAWRWERRHAVRPVTTRRVEPGPHVLRVQVNGAARGEAPFTVVQA